MIRPGDYRVFYYFFIVEWKFIRTGRKHLNKFKQAYFKVCFECSISAESLFRFIKKIQDD